LETSAKDSVNVESAFLTMAKHIKATMGTSLQNQEQQQKISVDIGHGTSVRQNQGGCC
jgi:Ras-related protein Rab-1A